MKPGGVQVAEPLLTQPHSVPGERPQAGAACTRGVWQPGQRTQPVPAATPPWPAADGSKGCHAQGADQLCTQVMGAGMHDQWVRAWQARPPPQHILSTLRSSQLQCASETRTAVEAQAGAAAPVACTHAPVTVTMLHGSDIADVAGRLHRAQPQGAGGQQAAQSAGSAPAERPGACGWQHVRVTAPAAWANVLLKLLVGAGAAAVGEAEAHSMRTAHGLPGYPHDSVADDGYWCAPVHV
jgi:hypothetical protein